MRKEKKLGDGRIRTYSISYDSLESWKLDTLNSSALWAW
jgi:hypothetical protein